jgi:uncharacterized SAM-binding protein YcdF (DUF218 family)
MPSGALINAGHNAGHELTALASPLTFGIASLFYAGVSHKRTARLVLLASAVLLLVCSLPASSHFILASLENRPGGNLDSTSGAPAIVVLGGGLANANGRSGPVDIGPHSDRLWMAFELYRAGKSPLILISGGSGSGSTPESLLAARVLRAWGVPPSAILTEEQSRDTHENAVFSQRILAGRGINRILLVTSAVHMPRASATFRRTGLTVFPVPTDFITGGEDQGWALSLLPSAGALTDSAGAIKEWLGIAAYRVRGWSQS